MKLGWNLSTISALAAFQLVYGGVVFFITRAIYDDDSVREIAAASVYESAPNNPTHKVPRGNPGKSVAALPGSGRFTAEHALEMVAKASAGATSASGDRASESPEQLSRIADKHFRDGRFEEAAIEYARVVKVAPHNVDVYNNLGLTLHYIGRGAEAVDYLKKGAALDADYQRIWLTLGFVQANMGDVAPARAALDRAVELGPDTRVGREALRIRGELPE